MAFQVGLLSEQPEEFGPLLEDREWQHDAGVEFPLVVRAMPARDRGRLRDLSRRVARQAEINATSFPSQLVAALLFRRFIEPRIDFEPLSRRSDRTDVDIDGVNHPDLIEAVRSHRLDALAIMNCGLLRQATIDASGVPILNVHDGDPSVMRGRPPFFWDLREGRRHTMITVHEVVASVDAGAVVAQLELALPRRRTLRSTLRAAELAARPARQRVLRQALADLASGTARPVVVEPGPLRTLPTLTDVWAASRACRGASSQK